MTEAEPTVSARQLVVPIYGATAINAVGRGTMLLLIPIQGLQLGGLMGGFSLPGMFALGAVLTNVPGAYAVMRYGHKPVMLAGLLLSALSAVGIAYSPALPAMTACAFLYGFGAGTVQFARIAYLSDMVAQEQRGRIVSAVGGSHRIGMFIGPAAGGAVAMWLGRPSALALVGLVTLVSAACVALLLPPGRTVPSSAPAAPWSMVARVLSAHRHTFLTAGVAMQMLSLVRQGRMLLIPICGTMLGLGEAEVGVAKSLSMGVDMVLFYPAGLAMDRFGRKWTAVPCLVIQSLGVLILGLAGSYEALLAGALVSGLGNGIGSGINMTLAGDLSPREGRAEFLGVWGLTGDLGGAAAPFVMGSVATAAGLGGAAALATALGLGGALLVALGMRETLVRSARPAPARAPD